MTDSVELGQSEVKGLCHVTATTVCQAGRVTLWVSLRLKACVLQVVTDSVELGQSEVKGLCHVTATTVSATRAEIRLSDFVDLQVVTDSVELGQAEVKGLCHVTATTVCQAGRDQAE